jgi:hypothetical protein
VTMGRVRVTSEDKNTENVYKWSCVCRIQYLMLRVESSRQQVIGVKLLWNLSLNNGIVHRLKRRFRHSAKFLLPKWGCLKNWSGNLASVFGRNSKMTCHRVFVMSRSPMCKLWYTALFNRAC